MKIKTWNIENETGYKPITTYFEDFSIADRFGIEAVKDTFEKNFKQSQYMGYKYLTEFVMALNWKIWEHYQTNKKLAELYNKLWEQADNFACENLKGEELQYFFNTTD